MDGSLKIYFQYVALELPPIFKLLILLKLGIVSSANSECFANVVIEYVSEKWILVVSILGWERVRFCSFLRLLEKNPKPYETFLAQIFQSIRRIEPPTNSFGCGVR